MKSPASTSLLSSLLSLLSAVRRDNKWRVILSSPHILPPSTVIRLLQTCQKTQFLRFPKLIFALILILSSKAKLITYRCQFEKQVIKFNWMTEIILSWFKRNSTNFYWAIKVGDLILREQQSEIRFIRSVSSPGNKTVTPWYTLSWRVILHCKYYVWTHVIDHNTFLNFFGFFLFFFLLAVHHVTVLCG